MFKKGQLVRSTRTGWLHVVDQGSRFETDFVWVRCVSRKTARPRLCVPVDEMVLVGNNYQPFDDPRAWSARKAKGW